MPVWRGLLAFLHFCSRRAILGIYLSSPCLYPPETFHLTSRSNGSFVLSKVKTWLLEIVYGAELLEKEVVDRDPDCSLAWLQRTLEGHCVMTVNKSLCSDAY